MTKYSEQFKLAAIQRYLAGPGGFTAVAKEIGVGVALIKRWVKFYRARGLDGIKAKPYVRHSAEFKLKVLQHMWDNHLSCAQTAAAFDVRGQCHISTWQRSYRAGGIDALMSASEKMTHKSSDPTDQLPAAPAAPSVEPAHDNRTREQLLARIDDLEMEIAYRKKLSALVQSQQAQPAQRKKRKS
jgi:transposase